MPTERKKHHRLIQSYGLFWDREEVGWHDRGAKLFGVARTGRPVDFRNQVGIYALYEGVSPALRRPSRRRKEHAV